LHRFDQRSNGFGLTAGRNDEILTRWNLEKILTNRVRGIDSNPKCVGEMITPSLMVSLKILFHTISKD
ncbi:hypothetical protein, partial [Enterococcus faecium]|uniref:hypothetical protein n=1 Tax=Enterococcus faecium TaxID=1352 RepID=UPI001E28C358